MVVTVPNLEKLQHYTGARPAWIKLYAKLLENFAFRMLPDAAKAHLILLWLLASRSCNRVPFDASQIEAMLGVHGVDFDALVASGFLAIVDEATLPPLEDAAAPKADYSNLHGVEIVDDSPVVATFPCAGTIATCDIHLDFLKEQERFFPGVDVARETNVAYQWIVSNPARKKTARGMRKFLTGWYARKQNQGRS